MEETSPDCHHPVCILAHELVNKLSTIVGQDLSHDPGQNKRQHPPYLPFTQPTQKIMVKAKVFSVSADVPSQEGLWPANGNPGSPTKH